MRKKKSYDGLENDAYPGRGDPGGSGAKDTQIPGEPKIPGTRKKRKGGRRTHLVLRLLRDGSELAHRMMRERILAARGNGLALSRAYGVSRRALYKWLEEFPELKELREGLADVESRKRRVATVRAAAKAGRAHRLALSGLGARLDALRRGEAVAPMARTVRPSEMEQYSTNWLDKWETFSPTDGWVPAGPP